MTDRVARHAENGQRLTFECPLCLGNEIVITVIVVVIIVVAVVLLLCGTQDVARNLNVT